MSQQTLSGEQARDLAKRRRNTKREQEKAAAQARRESYTLTTKPVTIRLPFPPMLNHYYRAMVVGKGPRAHAAIRIDQEGREFRELVIREWSQHVRLLYEGRLAIRVNVTWPDKRTRDGDGPLKALLDGLEHAGACANDSAFKLIIVEEMGTEPPGWVDVTLGPKPGPRQKSLFETAW